MNQETNRKFVDIWLRSGEVILRNWDTWKFTLVENTTLSILEKAQWAASRWRHKMEAFSALLSLCAGNSPVTGEFPSQRPVTSCFCVFVDMCLNKRLSK